MDEHRAEVDGWLAVWLIVRHVPRMMLVRNISEIGPIASFDTPAAAPDLAQMRERFPRLDKLWDAVRGEYWAELCPSRNLREGDTSHDRQH